MFTTVHLLYLSGCRQLSPPHPAAAAAAPWRSDAAGGLAPQRHRQAGAAAAAAVMNGVLVVEEVLLAQLVLRPGVGSAVAVAAVASVAVHVDLHGGERVERVNAGQAFAAALFCEKEERKKRVKDIVNAEV